MKKLSILTTADGHIERLPIEHFDKYLKYMKESIERIQPDIFIYCGDACDSRNVRAESDEYRNLTKYVVNLSNICKENNVKCIYVKGTPSHDGDVIKKIIDINDLDIKYVEHPEIFFFRGSSILLLPELYCPTLESFYGIIAGLLKNNHLDKVDLCAFHGMMDYAIPQLKQVDSHFNQSRSVVIDTNRFLDKFIHGIAFGGHVHSSIFNRNCYYVGRFINEKHQSRDSDLFGFKLVTCVDDIYSISNVENKYLLEYDFVDILITKDTTVNQILDDISKRDVVNHKTVFKVTLQKNKESRQIFNLWKKMYQPVNVKRKFIAESLNNLDVEEISKVNSATFDKSDIIDMTTKLYKQLSGDELDEITVNILFGDSNG